MVGKTEVSVRSQGGTRPERGQIPSTLPVASDIFMGQVWLLPFLDQIYQAI